MIKKPFTIQEVKENNAKEAKRSAEIGRLIEAIEELRGLRVEHEGIAIKDGKTADYGFLAFNKRCVPVGSHFGNELFLRMQIQINEAVKRIANETADDLETILRHEIEHSKL